jgi:hypothetical protein
MHVHFMIIFTCSRILTTTNMATVRIFVVISGKFMESVLGTVSHAYICIIEVYWSYFIVFSSLTIGD